MQSCWIEIDGNVYDVTEFLYEHPGGEAILLNVSGKPGAGKKFAAANHSGVAKNIMAEYAIGKWEAKK